MSTYFDDDCEPFDGRPLTLPRSSRRRHYASPNHGDECRPSNPEIGCVCGEDERASLRAEAAERTDANRFPIRDWRDAAAAAAQGASRYVRCEATNAEGERCNYGTGHRLERHSFEAAS